MDGLQGTALRRPDTAPATPPPGSFEFATVFASREVGDVKAFAVGADAACFAVRGKGLRKWGARSGAVQPFPAGVEGLDAVILAVAVVGGNLWAADGRGNVAVFDAASGDVLLRPFSAHNGEIRAIAASPHGGYVVTGGTDFQTRTWGPLGERLGGSGQHKARENGAPPARPAGGASPRPPPRICLSLWPQPKTRI
jgi:hypothetical protein